MVVDVVVVLAVIPALHLVTRTAAAAAAAVHSALAPFIILMADCRCTIADAVF